jgi:hypothetical protein
VETDVGIENQKIRLRANGGNPCINGGSIASVSAHLHDPWLHWMLARDIDGFVMRIVIDNDGLELFDTLQSRWQRIQQSWQNSRAVVGYDDN